MTIIQTKLLKKSSMSTSKTELQISRRERKAKLITYSDTFNPNGMLLGIQQQGILGCYRDILFNIHDQLYSLLSRHSKVFVMRFDFHTNPEEWKEGHFSELLKKALPAIKRRYKVRDIIYTWGREIGKNGTPHFHLMLAINGHKVNYPQKTHEIFQTHWSRLNQGGIHRANSHMLTNMVDANFMNAFYHLSYIAKVYSKDEQPKRIRSFGGSNLGPFYPPLKGSIHIR